MTFKKASTKNRPLPLLESATYCPVCTTEETVVEQTVCNCQLHPGPAVQVYTSFDEAVANVIDLNLKPGQSYTVFYKFINSNHITEYHCVIAIGNINPGDGVLILTDSGREKSITDQISELSAQVNKEVKDLDCFVRLTLADFNDVLDNYGNRIASVEGKMRLLSNTIDDVEEDVNNKLTEFANTISEMNNIIDAFEEKLLVLENNIKAINTSTANAIEEIEEDQNIKFNEFVVEMQNVVNELNSSTSNAISTFESSVDDVNDFVVAVNTSTSNAINELAETIISINSSISNSIDEVNINITELSDSVDTSINAITNYVNEYINNTSTALNKMVPISDASIISLFHYDIYTVNLCCYTVSGHVEITDNYPEPWTADCMPANEYKTYINGDVVKFTAVPSTGYKFYAWYKDGVEWTNTEEITLTINNKDIDVIGTTLDDTERGLLSHGYTAIFKELPTLTVNIVIDNAKIAEYDDDTVQITGAIDNKWFNEGDTITILPIARLHHTFEYFTVNGQRIDSKTISQKFYESVVVEAHFKETRFEVMAEPNIAETAKIVAMPNQGSLLEGTVIQFTAEPKDPSNYSFKYWKYDVDDDYYGTTADNIIAPIDANNNATSNPLTITAKNKDWHLVAFMEHHKVTIVLDRATGNFANAAEEAKADKLDAERDIYGWIIDTETKLSDTNKQLPALALEGYTFDGWYFTRTTVGGVQEFSNPVTEDSIFHETSGNTTVIYAKFVNN